MLTVEAALALIDKYLPASYRSEELLLQPLVADRDYPPFNRVMMDGIALSYEVFFSGKRRFTVAGVCPAGEPAARLHDFSSCLEVMTGAPLPYGADIVIPYEHLLIEDGVAEIIVEQKRSLFENVHLKGSDCLAGEILCPVGAVINGPHVGIAKSLGYTTLTTAPRPRINIISTGDELVAVEELPLEHQIRRSNSYAIEASLRIHGFHDLLITHLQDDENIIEEHFLKARGEFDVMIYSGGVSKGKFDYLPQVWEKMGVEKIFHGITQRPGKPMYFGMDHRTKTAIFGLPGNPVSSLVCLHRYFLKKKEMWAILDEEITFNKDLTYFIPVNISNERSGSLKARPLKIKNSGEFSALSGSDGFLELPKDKTVFKKGEAFLFHSWRGQ